MSWRLDQNIREQWKESSRLWYNVKILTLSTDDGTSGIGGVKGNQKFPFLTFTCIDVESV